MIGSNGLKGHPLPRLMFMCRNIIFAQSKFNFPGHSRENRSSSVRILCYPGHTQYQCVMICNNYWAVMRRREARNENIRNFCNHILLSKNILCVLVLPLHGHVRCDSQNVDSNEYKQFNNSVVIRWKLDKQLQGYFKFNYCGRDTYWIWWHFIQC